MAQLRRMATAYRRLLSDFYLPDPPQDDPLPTTSGACRERWRSAIPRHCDTFGLLGSAVRSRLTLPPSWTAISPTYPAACSSTTIPKYRPELRRLLGVTLDTQRAWRNPRTSYNGWRVAIERAGILVFQVSGIAPSEMLGFSLPLPPASRHRRQSQAASKRAHIYAAPRECARAPKPE